RQLNSLGYYPPARALVIRGTTRYHPAATIKLKKAEGQALGEPNPRAGGGPIVIGPGGGSKPTDPRPPGGQVASTPPRDPKDPKDPPKDPAKDPNAGAVASAGPGKPPTLVDPKFDPKVLKPRLSGDPHRKWSEAIDW